jgi:hypothetical protein
MGSYFFMSCFVYMFQVLCSTFFCYQWRGGHSYSVLPSNPTQDMKICIITTINYWLPYCFGVSTPGPVPLLRFYLGVCMKGLRKFTGIWWNGKCSVAEVMGETWEYLLHQWSNDRPSPFGRSDKRIGSPVLLYTNKCLPPVAFPFHIEQDILNKASVWPLYRTCHIDLQVVENTKQSQVYRLEVIIKQCTYI